MTIKLIEWEPEYATGSDSVDLQHQYFSKLINRIITNLTEEDDAEHEKRLLSELVKYADFHFTSEENIAFRLGIEGLSLHHQRHMELLDELNNQVDNLLWGNHSKDDFIQFLVHWYTGHTFYEDTQFFHKYYK